MLDLASAYHKLDRAKELLDGLDAEVLAWMDLKPYTCFPYISPNYRRASIIVKAHHDPPIVRWSLIVADIIHNIRCALDHAFWAILLNEFGGKAPAKADKLSFPIWDAAPTSNQKRTFEPIGLKLFTAIESVQPYHHPFPDLPVHPLDIIRDIDNANKHKLLFTVMASAARLEVKATNLRNNNQDGIVSELYLGEIKDGVEAVVTIFDTPHPYMKYECPTFTTIIAIRHPIADRIGRDRDDYAWLIDTLLAETRSTIDRLVAAI